MEFQEVPFMSIVLSKVKAHHGGSAMRREAARVADTLTLQADNAP